MYSAINFELCNNSRGDNPRCTKKLRFNFDNFNKKAVAILNEILQETGAEIVVSSDWKRWANVEEMGEYYEAKGIIKKPIAYTPNLAECNWYNAGTFVWAPKWDLEQTRAIEIKQYFST